MILESIVIAVSSNYQEYLWSNNGTLNYITVSSSGTYNVTVTDSGGCQATSDIVVVNVVPNPTVSVTSGQITSSRITSGFPLLSTQSFTTNALTTIGFTTMGLTSMGLTSQDYTGQNTVTSGGDSVGLSVSCHEFVGQ